MEQLVPYLSQQFGAQIIFSVSMLYIAVRVSFKRMNPVLCVITEILYKCIESLILVSLYYFTLKGFLGFVVFF